MLNMIASRLSTLRPLPEPVIQAFHDAPLAPREPKGIDAMGARELDALIERPKFAPPGHVGAAPRTGDGCCTSGETQCRLQLRGGQHFQ